MSSEGGSSDGGTPVPGGLETNGGLEGLRDGGTPLQEQQQTMNDPGINADDDDTLETSFFPSPAHYYKRYTNVNLALPLESTICVVGDEHSSVVTRAELEPPRVDWIIQGGSYSVFGDTWPVEEVLPTLQEQGVKEMFERGQGEKRSTTLRHRHTSR